MQSSLRRHKRTRSSAAPQRRRGPGEFIDATDSLAFAVAVAGPWPDGSALASAARRSAGRPTGTKQLLTVRSKDSFTTRANHHVLTL